MRMTIGLVGLIFVGVSGWFIGSRLSPDAIGMAVGILFGILAGIPAALMVMASRRQSDRYHEHDPYGAPQGGRRGRDRTGQITSHGHAPYPQQQPPVIILAGNGVPHQMGQPVGGYAANGYPAGYQQYGNQQYGTGAQQQLALPGPVETPAAPPAGRQFRVVGEEEEWIDSF